MAKYMTYMPGETINICTWLKQTNNTYTISDYFEFDYLSDLKGATVVEATKRLFARNGSPVTCVTDNGPQFVCDEYAQLAKKWNFKHITSSPYHSQSNGRAEAAVKSVKNLLKRCHDPLLGLLHLRNTPTKGNTYSAVQRLMGRRTRTSMPVAPAMLRPDSIPPEDVRADKAHQRQKSKQQYDNTAGPPLPEIQVSEPVYIRPPPTKHGQLWQHSVLHVPIQ